MLLFNLSYHRFPDLQGVPKLLINQLSMLALYSLGTSSYLPCLHALRLLGTSSVAPGGHTQSALPYRNNLLSCFFPFLYGWKKHNI